VLTTLPIDSSTTRQRGYALSQRARKTTEEPFGWAKQIGPMRKTKLRVVERVGFQWLLSCTGYDLIRMRNLLGPPARAQRKVWPMRAIEGRTQRVGAPTSRTHSGKQPYTGPCWPVKAHEYHSNRRVFNHFSTASLAKPDCPAPLVMGY